MALALEFEPVLAAIAVSSVMLVPLPVLTQVLAVVPVLAPRSLFMPQSYDVSPGKKERENLAGFFLDMAPSAEPWGARRDRPSGRARGGEQSSPPSVGGISFRPVFIVPSSDSIEGR